MIASILFFAGVILAHNEQGRQWEYPTTDALVSCDSICASTKAVDGGDTDELVLGDFNIAVEPCELAEVTVEFVAESTHPVLLSISLHNEQGGVLQTAYAEVTATGGTNRVTFANPVFSSKLMRPDFTVHLQAHPYADYSYSISLDYFGISALPFE